MTDTLVPRIEALKAPHADQRLLLLLWHKGSPWIEDIGRRLEGRYPQSRDCFLVAYGGDEIAAHAWYTVARSDPRLGLLGHVFTRPEYRRRGLATRLLETALERFHREGGLSMQLFTYEPQTLPFYERLGFETIQAGRAGHSGDWYLRGPAPSRDLVDAWFAARACRVRPLESGDLPKYCLLYNLEGATKLKDRAQAIGLGLEAELAFIRTIERLDRSAGQCLVLDNGETIAGIASLAAIDFPHEAHVGLVDCYVHPAYSSRAPELVDGVLAEQSRLRLDVVYAMAVDADKQRLFERLGFRRAASLAGHYRVEERTLDCAVYRAG